MKLMYLFFAFLWIGGISFAQKDVRTDRVVSFSSNMLYVGNESIGSVTDMLYWDGEAYLIDKSFLSMLKGHKDIYPSIPLEVSIVIASYTCGSLSEKNYFPLWLLKGGRLYLREINFLTHPSNYYRPQGEYRLMERFTKQKFRKSGESFALLEPKESVVGSMFASWVSGIYFVKKARLPEEPFETFETWPSRPYYRLVFKNGRLISTDTIRPLIPEPEKRKIPILDNPIKLY